MPDWALAMKLSEECGELNEAMLKDLGFLQHKGELEGPLGEAADVIIVAISAIAAHCPELPQSALVEQLRTALVEKTNKYKNILGVNCG